MTSDNTGITENQLREAMAQIAAAAGFDARIQLQPRPSPRSAIDHAVDLATAVDRILDGVGDILIPERDRTESRVARIARLPERVAEIKARLHLINEAFTDVTALCIGSRSGEEVKAHLAVHELWEADPRAALLQLLQLLSEDGVLNAAVAAIPEQAAREAIQARLSSDPSSLISEMLEFWIKSPRVEISTVVSIVAATESSAEPVMEQATPLVEMWKTDRTAALAEMLEAWLTREMYQRGAQEMRVQRAEDAATIERLRAQLAEATTLAEWFREVTEARDAVINAEYIANQPLYTKADGSPMPEAEILQAVVASRDGALRALAEIGAVTPDGLRPSNPTAFWIDRVLGPVGEQIRANILDLERLHRVVGEMWVAARRWGRAQWAIAAAQRYVQGTGSMENLNRAVEAFGRAESAAYDQDTRAAGLMSRQSTVRLGPSILPDSDRLARAPYEPIEIVVGNCMTHTEDGHEYLTLATDPNAMVRGAMVGDRLREWRLVTAIVPTGKRYHEMVVIDCGANHVVLAHADSPAAIEALRARGGARPAAGDGPPGGP